MICVDRYRHGYDFLYIGGHLESPPVDSHYETMYLSSSFVSTFCRVPQGCSLGTIPFDSLISPFLTYDRDTLAWGSRYFNTLHSFGC